MGVVLREAELRKSALLLDGQHLYTDKLYIITCDYLIMGLSNLNANATCLTVFVVRIHYKKCVLGRVLPEAQLRRSVILLVPHCYKLYIITLLLCGEKDHLFP